MMKDNLRTFCAIVLAAFPLATLGGPLEDALATWHHFSSTDWWSSAAFDQYYQTANWADKREFELAMIQASCTEYIWENVSFTNALTTFIQETDNDELRREGHFVYSEILRAICDPDELTNAPARWSADVSSFMSNPSSITNTWLLYMEAGMLIADETENGRAAQGYVLGTNILHFSQSVPCTSDSLLWHRYKHEIGPDPVTAIDGVRLATAYAAKVCGEYAAASNLVSTFPTIEQQLLWIDDDSVIEIDETNGTVTVIEPGNVP